MPTTRWAVRHEKYGYLIDTCAGGTWSGPETLTWDAHQVSENALTWSNTADAEAAITAADIERDEHLDLFFVDIWL